MTKIWPISCGLKRRCGSYSTKPGLFARRPGRQKSARQSILELTLFFASKSTRGSGRDGSLMVVSNRFSGKGALKIYRQGWGIGRLFGHLKKNGFDLEATHMTRATKREMLFALTVLAFHFSFAWGCRLRERTRKMTAAASRKSVFRLGLEDLMSLFDRSNPDPSQEARRSEFWRWLPSETFHSIFLVSCGNGRSFLLELGRHLRSRFAARRSLGLR
jgi:hypothetical protein